MVCGQQRCEPHQSLLHPGAAERRGVFFSWALGSETQRTYLLLGVRGPADAHGRCPCNDATVITGDRRTGRRGRHFSLCLRAFRPKSAPVLSGRWWCVAAFL
ncbi:unnamed protein product [Symbiodinium pilosum]|uniref:Uncharacterized protein n=1 Tax=Symbiodinium pilosum TaxID=2952 RepID=A0A812VWX9_SYMPI|nr:unnamed protein product [Symbiodinium pilosum]